MYGLNLPRIRIPVKRKLRGYLPAAARKGCSVGQKRLNALWHYGAQIGSNRSPYGRRGDPVKKEQRKRRIRLQLREARKVALEMHELQQLARENAVGAMQTLIDISRNERAPEPARIAASAVILDRGYGKASQVTMSANLNSGKANEITGDELDKRIGRALERVEELTKRAPKAPSSQDRSPNLRKLN